MAGEVVALGPDVGDDFQIGNRVCGHANLVENGTFAEYVVMHAYSLVKVPANVSNEQAAAILCAGMSAYQAINRKANLVGKLTVLIHGGAGGVGLIAIQLAKQLGLYVITTVSSQKIEFVKSLGADDIIDYRHDNVTERVLDITNDVGVDLSINPVSSAEVQEDINERLAYNGQVIGLVDLPRNIDVDLLASRGITVSALNLGGAHQSKSDSQNQDLALMAQSLLTILATHEIDSKIEATLPFDQLMDGLEMIKSHRNTGKIIVTLK
ncbi:zinc-binding dehydrogenase [Weissella diestrammenae]|nr:zinc-binding dehydrogenase [Weissella diestrammenae]